MKRCSAIAAALLLLGLTAFWHSQPASGQADAGWVTLFDGSNLNDWNQIGDANWRIVDGAVQADKGNGFLVSKNSYFIRCTNPEKVGTDSSYEVNIFDTRPDPSYGTGAIVNIAKVSPMPKAGEKWNNYEVTANGPKLTVTLNGVRTVDGVEDSKFASGRIALQYGAGVVKFRKVQVKPI